MTRQFAANHLPGPTSREDNKRFAIHLTAVYEVKAVNIPYMLPFYSLPSFLCFGRICIQNSSIVQFFTQTRWNNTLPVTSHNDGENYNEGVHSNFKIRRASLLQTFFSLLTDPPWVYKRTEKSAHVDFFDSLQIYSSAHIIRILTYPLQFLKSLFSYKFLFAGCNITGH